MINKKNKIIKHVLFLLFSFLCISLELSSKIPAGQFLIDVNPNARLYSMGDQSNAMGYDDVYTAPASLGLSINRGYYLSYWPGELEDSKYGFLGTVMPVSVFKKTFLSLSYLSYTAGDETVEELDGSTKSISLESDKLFSAGIGFPLTDQLFAGGNIKYLSSTLAEDYNAKTFLFDLSFLYRTLDNKESFEVGLFNAGGSLKYIDYEESVPKELRLGYSHRYDFVNKTSLIASFSYGHISADSSNSLSCGIEFLPKSKLFSLRSGFIKRTDTDLEWTAGFGINFNNMDIDFGYALKKTDYDRAAPYRISLKYNFGSNSDYDAAESYLERGMNKRAIALLHSIDKDDVDYKKARKKLKSLDPPVLNFVTYFKTDKGDDKISSGDSGEIIIDIRNNGNTAAEEIYAEVIPADNMNDIEISSFSEHIPLLLPSEEKTIKISIRAMDEITMPEFKFNIKVKEADGFNPVDSLFTIKAKSFLAPDLLLAKYVFYDGQNEYSLGNGNGIIERGETIQLQGVLENLGNLPAEDVSISVESLDERIKIRQSSTTVFDIGDLKPHEYKIIDFSFDVDENYFGFSRIPIVVNIKEKREKFSKVQNIELMMNELYLAPIIASDVRQSDLAMLPEMSFPSVSSKTVQESLKPYYEIKDSFDFDADIDMSGDLNNNGIFEAGEKIVMNVEINNYTNKEAKDVKILISGDERISKLLGNQYNVGDIGSNTSKKIRFIADIPQSIMSGKSNFSIKVKSKNISSDKALKQSLDFRGKESTFNISTELTRIPDIILENKPMQNPNFAKLGLSSTVVPELKNIADMTQEDKQYSYAFIVGVSDYKFISSDFGYVKGDVDTIKKYITDVIGVPEKNVYILENENATKSEIENELIRMKDKNLRSIYFYYAGKGISYKKQSGMEQYILPYDAELSDTNDMLLSVKYIISILKETKAKKIFLMLNSCFPSTDKTDVKSEAKNGDIEIIPINDGNDKGVKNEAYDLRTIFLWRWCNSKE